jgi:hypothetical protein
MDCKNARLLLNFARPLGTELDATDAEALESHLADCPECGPLAQEERRFDDHLGRAMRTVPVPENLRERLLRHLAVERDAWYRRWVLRTAGAVAAAAAIVLVVWGGLLWYPRPVAAIDFTEIRPDRSASSPREVEEWFRSVYGIKTVAPSDNVLNYTWLTHYDLDDFQGQRVPMLLFSYNGHDSQTRAQVFIVTDKQFSDLDEKVNQPRKITGGYTVEVFHDPDTPGVYYIAVYTDGSRDRFFRKRSVAT